MIADPLVMDVLRDDRTLWIGNHRYARAGVEYEFTEEEIEVAIFAMLYGVNEALSL